MVSNPAKSSASTATASCRALAVAWDVRAPAITIVHVTYGQYSGRYNEAQIGANSPVGQSARHQFHLYAGPAGQGRGFAPGFDLANYPLTSANAFVFKRRSRTSFMAAGSEVAADARVHGVVRREPFGTDAATPRPPTSAPRTHDLDRGLPDDWPTASATCWSRSPVRSAGRRRPIHQRRLYEPDLPEHEPGPPRIPGAGVPVALPHHRATGA